MKKVLALVLAVAMMSTVAFAAAGMYQAGDDVKLTGAMIGASGALNDDNYTIKKVTYDAGKAYIDSIKLDDDEGDELKITFKKDYSIDKAKDVDVTIELKGKGDYKTDKVTYPLVCTYGYGVTNINITNTDTDITEADLGGLINANTTDFVKFVDAGAPYTTLDVDIDADTNIVARVYAKDKVLLANNYDADKKVLIANADSDAEISFLNFPAKPSFNSTVTVSFYQVDEDGFVYELTGDGKIKKSAAKWSEDDGCWVLKTRTLGSYVFSDKALTSAAAAEEAAETTNPDTGANDVVGIATALAVVSLVAAGAVSLKK